MFNEKLSKEVVGRFGLPLLFCLFGGQNVLAQMHLQFPSWFLQPEPNCVVGYQGRGRALVSDSLDLQQRFQGYQHLVVSGQNKSYGNGFSWTLEDSVMLFPKTVVSQKWDSLFKIGARVRVSGRYTSIYCPGTSILDSSMVDEDVVALQRPNWISSLPKNIPGQQYWGVGLARYNRYDELGTWMRCDENALYNLARSVSVSLKSFVKDSLGGGAEVVQKEQINVELRSASISKRWYDQESRTLFCLAMSRGAVPLVQNKTDTIMPGETPADSSVAF